ncbi:hypothetical protein Tco_1476861 [Tanacetum coccineum]
MAVVRRGCRGTAAGGKGTKWRVEARDYEDRIDRGYEQPFDTWPGKASRKIFSGGMWWCRGGCDNCVVGDEERS